MKVFQVLSAGSYTTVQDSGRMGSRNMGVPVSGALDAYAFRVANLLVGNPRESAVLESTFIGPAIEVLSPVDVAVTGADSELKLNGEAIPAWQSVRVQPGDMLEIGKVRSGCRAYLSVSGGIDVPAVLGSRSTCTGAKIGGVSGRIIRAGDTLNAFPTDLLDFPRSLPGLWIPEYPCSIILRVISGPQEHFFSTPQAGFFSSEFTISPQADRMGYRLTGPAIYPGPEMPQSIVSEPVMPGCVQIPPDGQPIILLGEQTVGGYNKIAVVISVDLAKVAQAMPGDKIRFKKVSLETAHTFYRDQERTLSALAASFMPNRLLSI